MTRRFLPLALVGLAATALSAVVGCSSSPAGGGPDGGAPMPEASVPEAGLPEAAVEAGALVVTPSSASVLTCETLQLTETGGAAGGTWSVSPSTGAGTISDAGSYAAPLVAPSSPAVTIGYAAGSASATAALNVATAFVGPTAVIPIDAGTDNVTSVPFEHQLAANGTHMYLGLGAQSVAQTGAFLEAHIYASVDNGKTFKGPTVYHTGDLSCMTIAVDSGNPNVVYLAYLAGHGDSTSNTGATLRLAVSTDGAATFPVEYDLVDKQGSLANFICPDVTSPSANHVIVAGVASDDVTAHVATFVSSNQGAGIGPVSQEGLLMAANADGGVSSGTDTNAGSTVTCGIVSNGGGTGPRVFSNGAGMACTVFQYAPGCPKPNNVAVQCSADNGGTWTTPVTLGYPQADAQFYPTGSVSPGGKVAIAWLDTVAGDAGSYVASFVTISKDGGKTFGTPTQYPAAFAMPYGYTNLPVVAWENDTVLWLSQTGIGPSNAALFVDKTCDDGVSWSGPVKVGPYGGTSLFLTSTGMVLAGDIAAGNSGGPSVMTFSLAP